MHRKAVKQLDKLTQWTGERFQKENKTEHADEFKELEHEIEGRKRGAERLYATSVPFHSSLSKRKPSSDPYPETSSKDKLLSGESLGLVMISYGEELARSGSERELGHKLAGFGRARCGIATAQEEFASRLGEGYLTGMESTLANIKEYELGRKKLDSKRSALDATMKKLGSSKKDTRIIESEIEIAQERYDETQEDVYTRMLNIQQSEAQHLSDLNDFLDAELEFVGRYQQILSDLKCEWTTGATPTSTTRPRSKSTSAVSKSVANRAIPPPSRVPTRPSFHPVAARKVASSDDEEKSASVQSRSRSHSNVSTGSSRSRMDLASMVPSFGKKSATRFTSEQKYGSLKDDETGLRSEEEERYSGDVSPEEEEAYGQKELRTPTKAPHAHSRTVRVVKAVYNYQATADDELSLDIGDIIHVTRDVSSDWWIGENEDGARGLFPSSYTLPYQTNGVVPPVPAVAHPRALPVTAAVSRSLAPPHARSISEEDEEGYPSQYMAPPVPAPSPLKKNKPPPPPIRRSTTASSAGGAGAKAYSSSPAKPVTFEPSAGSSRMVMPGRTPPPMKRASSALATKSPFGGSEDEDGVDGTAATPDCSVCGCDDFTQNVFKASGTCSLCFHMH